MHIQLYSVHILYNSNTKAITLARGLVTCTVAAPARGIILLPNLEEHFFVRRFLYLECWFISWNRTKPPEINQESYPTNKVHTLSRVYVACDLKMLVATILLRYINVKIVQQRTKYIYFNILILYIDQVEIYRLHYYYLLCHQKN